VARAGTGRVIEVRWLRRARVMGVPWLGWTRVMGVPWLGWTRVGSGRCGGSRRNLARPRSSHPRWSAVIAAVVRASTRVPAASARAPERAHPDRDRPRRPRATCAPRQRSKVRTPSTGHGHALAPWPRAGRPGRRRRARAEAQRLVRPRTVPAARIETVRGQGQPGLRNRLGPRERCSPSRWAGSVPPRHPAHAAGLAGSRRAPDGWRFVSAHNSF
jgi:hypothetical protein